MKKSLFIIGLVAITLGLGSCDKKHNEKEPPADSNSIVLNTDKEWTTSTLSAYIGDISALPDDLQTVIPKRFPKTASLETAKVIFAGPGDIAANTEKIAKAAEDGAFIVVPPSVDLSQIGARPIVSPAGSEEFPVLLLCYSGYGEDLLYVMYDETDIPLPEAGAPSMSDKEWEELIRINKEMDDYVGTSETDYDNDSAKNENYFQTRMDPFVEWLDSVNKERGLFTNSDYSYDELKENIEQSGQRLTCNYSFTLNEYIDKATWSDPDFLCKSGSVSVEYHIYPIYMLMSNGLKAGDYYGVVCTVTPHNQSLWGPYAAAHGWCRNRIYGYWFYSMDVNTDLVNIDGKRIYGLEYYERPIPENQNDSKTYSHGKTFSLTGSFTGGISGGQKYIVGQIALGGTWTSTTNYTLETINYTLDSSTPEVKYHYWSENVKLTDDWDDWTIINQDYPAPVRSEFSAHSMWVWHVPASEVQDGDTKQFTLLTYLNLKYATWYHWRGALEYDSNLAIHEVRVPPMSWILDRPNRTPWGLIKLRNATSNEMAHVAFYKKGEEGGEPVAKLTTSYGKGDEARIGLPEGTYSVTWDIVDGDTGAILSSWIYRDVTVHQGKDDESATIRISTVDGEEINVKP